MGQKVVVWAQYARRKLQKIYGYYAETASIETADRVVNRLINATIVLTYSPYVGQREPLLDNFAKEFRYLVVGNWIIVYFVEQNEVSVVDVFDCRQNPTAIIDFTK